MNQRGFTLVEIVAVLVIIAIIASIAVVKFMKTDEAAVRVVFRGALVGINDTEIHHWTNTKLNSKGFESDSQIFDLVREDLINVPEWKWKELSPTGGTLTIKQVEFRMVRKPSTGNQYAIWQEVSNNG